MFAFILKIKIYLYLRVIYNRKPRSTRIGTNATPNIYTILACLSNKSMNYIHWQMKWLVPIFLVNKVFLRAPCVRVPLMPQVNLTIVTKLVMWLGINANPILKICSSSKEVLIFEPLLLLLIGPTLICNESMPSHHFPYLIFLLF